MTIKPIQEGEPTWLPGVRLSDLPSPLPASIRLFSRGDQLGIDADGVVGSIPLGNGDSLHILPKIGEVNFLRMLFRTLGRQADVERQFDDFASYGVEEREGLPALAARRSVRAADLVLRRGASTTRVRDVRRASSATGQLLPAPTALALARRERDPVFTRLRIRSHDSPENRLIFRALLTAAGILLSADRDYAIEVCAKWNRRVSGAPLTESDLRLTQKRLAMKAYQGPRGYYGPAVTLALVLLGSLGLTLDAHPSVEGDPILLNSADVFENYVRRVISDHYGAAGCFVSKGGSVPLTLYEDGTFGIRPDVVVERHSAVLLVGDAKYKTPSPDDHYQLLAYLATMNAHWGVLLTPNGRFGAVQLSVHRTLRGYVTLVADLPMADLETTERFLADVVAQCQARLSRKEGQANSEEGFPEISELL